MASTIERYTLKELRKDAARVAELTERGRVALNDAATIANRIEAESVEEVRFTFEDAIRHTAGGISKDIVAGETKPATLAEYAGDLVKLVEFAAEGVDA